MRTTTRGRFWRRFRRRWGGRLGPSCRTRIRTTRNTSRRGCAQMMEAGVDLQVLSPAAGRGPYGKRRVDFAGGGAAVQRPARRAGGALPGQVQGVRDPAAAAHRSLPGRTQTGDGAAGHGGAQPAHLGAGPVGGGGRVPADLRGDEPAQGDHLLPPLRQQHLLADDRGLRARRRGGDVAGGRGHRGCI